METKEMTLLLVGNTGNGKSATGNSILRQQAFKTTASTSSSSMSEFVIASSSFRDVKINVLDGPGIDTNRSAEEVLNLSIVTLTEALKLLNYRFSALVIVLKYGSRFTQQESDSIKFIKGILGRNVIRDFGVCIITQGDNFEADNEDDNVSFKDWCQQQEGEIKNLFEECNYRCVMFNNRTKDEHVKDSQVSELITMVPGNIHYNKSDFKDADSDLQKLIIETKMPSILKETNDFIDGKRNPVRNIQSFLDVAKQIQSYHDVLNLINEFEQKLSERYHGPDNIQQPLKVLKIFKMDVDLKLKTCERNQQLQQEKARAEHLNRTRRDQSQPVATGLQGNEHPSYHNERQVDIERSNQSEKNTPYGAVVKNLNPDESCWQKVFRWLRNE